MKIGIIGRISPALLMACRSIRSDIEIVETTQDQADEDKKLVATCGGLNIGLHQASEIIRSFELTQKWEPIKRSGKTGHNKSDRKRNRADRWR